MRLLLGLAVAIAGVAAWARGFGPLVLGLLILAAVLWVRAKIRTTTGPGAVLGHSHGGTRARIATHEAGHVVGARGVGGRVTSAWLTNDEGHVSWDMPHRDLEDEVRSNLTFLIAGEYAAGTGQGCGGDRDSYRRQLRRLPTEDRSRVRSTANRDARRIVSSNRGEIRRVAERLNENGRL